MSKEILVIGCGSIGERHLRCLLRVGNVRVTACDANPALLQKISEQYQVPAFASASDAFASRQFGGVVICTPAHTHIRFAIAALQHGAGVLIEKPLSVECDGLEELQTVAARSGMYLGVAYVYHFMPAVSQARAFIQGAAFGKPLQVTVFGGQHFPTYRPAYRDIYYNKHETGGGLIQDALTHLANAVEWIVGPTDKVFCLAAHQALEGVTVEDTACVAAQNGSTLVSYSMNQFQRPNEHSLQVHCEGGSVKVEIHEQRWGIFPNGADQWDYRCVPVGHRDDLFTAQAAAFMDGLEGKATAICTLDEAIQTLKFNRAALRSARTGQVITI